MNLFIKKLGCIKLLILCLLCFEAISQSTAPTRFRGLYDIWYKDDSVLNFPYIKGGQIMLQWADVEPSEGRYDFSLIEKKLKKFKAAGKFTTIQINGNNKPLWLYNKVPYNKKILSNQIKDDKGSLMYWHHTYINAYLNLIKAYAKYIKSSAYLSQVAGIRMNFNALGTEHTSVPSEERNLAQWVVPAGVNGATAFDSTTAMRYMETITNAFVKEFGGVNLMIRNNISEAMIEKLSDKFESGQLMLFHTSSELEPREENKYYLFKKFAGSGKTLAYAEPWANAWGERGKIQDARWATPPQWNYWRLLLDLHSGVSMIALYDADVQVAYSGIYPVTQKRVPFQNEFLKAFRFAASYAGYHASPALSPGAWIAFRYSSENVPYKKPLKEFSGNYQFLMEEVSHELKSQSAYKNIGTHEQRFGAWAKMLMPGSITSVKINPVFIKSLAGATGVIRMVYQDSGNAAIKLIVDNKTYRVNTHNSSQWKTIEFVHQFSKVPSDEMKITAEHSFAFLHMINIERGNGLPAEVSDLKWKAGKEDVLLQWNNPLVADLDSIRIYGDSQLQRTIPAFNTEANIPAGIKHIKITTVDEAGRESAGVKIDR